MPPKQDSQAVENTPTPEPTPPAPVEPFAAGGAQPQQPKVIEVPFIGNQQIRPAHPTPGDTGEQAESFRANAEPAEKTFTQAEVDKLMATVRRSVEKQMEDARAKEVENAKLSETERQTKERQEIEAKQRETEQKWLMERRKNAVIIAAVNAKLDPDAAVRLIDGDALRFDESGNATNAGELVKAVAEKWPGLVSRLSPAMPAAGAVNPPRDSQPAGQAEADMRRKYFGGGGSTFFQGGGVRLPDKLKTGE